MRITVDSEGNLHYLEKPETESLRQLGTATTKRASHIEPCNWLLRLAFHAVRMAGKRGEAFSRTWPVDWRVNLKLSNGPTFGRFADRSKAIEAEEQWLADNNMGAGNGEVCSKHNSFDREIEG